ncbi:hypothetical protein [Streptacidiphilus neutrinimicus]|uniref:hypothetical protein n=1 Tax=Streptacidiphilus neutrinimicus TaxID=105420 RepID=UPI0005AA726A|nr:hypothetical protein [Streptacidiphilus neutrinimicus]
MNDHTSSSVNGTAMSDVDRRRQATDRRWVAAQIGPRQVGGVYRTRHGDVYEVLDIEPGPRPTWPTWRISVRTLGSDTVRRHCTAWEDRDQVLAEPGPAADIWRAAYTRTVAPGDVACERHALDGADWLFHQLAPGYAAAQALAATTAMEVRR